MEFEWDDGNRDKNRVKHGVTNREAEECYGNFLIHFPPRVVLYEPRTSLLGVTNAGRRLAIVYTVRRGRVRVISARPMSRRERRIYEAYQKAACLQK